ncbi:unnamed protein product [Gulo gulo]|uniref:Uncharacterized protein n=1 Tax=Gulo gulo TaxID=48420 RepID=A0A9X9LS64_GULGU|nr:unnamed protein product [Gulo gulo]
MRPISRTRGTPDWVDPPVPPRGAPHSPDPSDPSGTIYPCVLKRGRAWSP